MVRLSLHAPPLELDLPAEGVAKLELDRLGHRVSPHLGRVRLRLRIRARARVRVRVMVWVGIRVRVRVGPHLELVQSGAVSLERPHGR